MEKIARNFSLKQSESFQLYENVQQINMSVRGGGLSSKIGVFFCHR